MHEGDTVAGITRRMCPRVLGCMLCMTLIPIPFGFSVAGCVHRLTFQKNWVRPGFRSRPFPGPQEQPANHLGVLIPALDLPKPDFPRASNFRALSESIPFCLLPSLAWVGGPAFPFVGLSKTA